MEQKELKVREISGKEYNYLEISDEIVYRTDLYIKLKVTNELKELLKKDRNIDNEVFYALTRNCAESLTILTMTLENMTYVTLMLFEKDGKVIGHSLSVSYFFIKYIQAFLDGNRNDLLIESEGSCLDYLEDENYKVYLKDYYSPKSVNDNGLYYQGKDVELGKTYKLTNFNIKETDGISLALKKTLLNSNITELELHLNGNINMYNMIGHLKFKKSDGNHYTAVEHLIKVDPNFGFKTKEAYKTHWEMDAYHKFGLKALKYYNGLQETEGSVEGNRVMFANYLDNLNKLIDAELEVLEEDYNGVHTTALSQQSAFNLLSLPNIVLEQI